MENKQVILLKYGEVVLKGLNRRYFEKILERDAAKRLQKCGNYSLTAAQSTMYISPLDDAARLNIQATAEACARIFGVVSVCIAEELPKDTDTILAFVGDYVKRVKGAAKTFKVTGKRSDKRFPLTSP